MSPDLRQVSMTESFHTAFVRQSLPTANSAAKFGGALTFEQAVELC
jgi:hypothetical protein